MKSGRPLYGEVGKFKDTAGRLSPSLALPFLLELPAFARDLLLRFHAHHLSLREQNINHNLAKIRYCP